MVFLPPCGNNLKKFKWNIFCQVLLHLFRKKKSMWPSRILGIIFDILEYGTTKYIQSLQSFYSP